MNIPDLITAGESRIWQDPVQYDDLGNSLTSDIWTLTYSLRGPSTGPAGGCDITATANGNGWQSNMTTALSSPLLGEYTWSAYVQKGSDATTRYVVGKGQLTILKNIAGISPTAGYDGRSPLEIDITNIDLAVSRIAAALAAGDRYVRVVIQGREREVEATKEQIDGLLTARSDLARRLNKFRQQQMIKNGEGDPRTIKMRFRSPF